MLGRPDPLIFKKGRGLRQTKADALKTNHASTSKLHLHAVKTMNDLL